MLRQSLDRLGEYKEQQDSADVYIAELEKDKARNEKLIALAEENKALRQEKIDDLEARVKNLQGTLDNAVKATEAANKEADRQRGRASRWKSIAKWGTAAGVAIGVIATLALTKN